MAWPVQQRRSSRPCSTKPSMPSHSSAGSRTPAGRAIPQRAVSSDRRGARPRDGPRLTLRLVIDGAGARDDRAVSRDASRAHRGSWRSSRPFNGARRRTGSPVRGDPHVRLRPPRPACPSSKHPRGDLHPLQSARCPPLHLRGPGVELSRVARPSDFQSARRIRTSGKLAGASGHTPSLIRALHVASEPAREPFGRRLRRPVSRCRRTGVCRIATCCRRPVRLFVVVFVVACDVGR